MMLNDSKTAIDEITRRLILAAHPTKIILFGSFARGTSGPDSDIDILVVEKEVVSKHDLLAEQKITPPFSEDDLQWLTPYATILRHDEQSEEPLDRKKALDLISSIRKWAEQRVGKG